MGPARRPPVRPALVAPGARPGLAVDHRTLTARVAFSSSPARSLGP
jgi:hypothetical protein